MSNVAVLDSYSMFMKEVNSAPLLNKQEELCLAESLKNNNDKEAAQKLILSQLRNVCYIANTYSKFGLQKMDLIQEGVIGLMKAVKKFDPDKGFRLSTYASFWIKESIHNFVLNSWSMVKFGTTKLQRSIFSGLRNSKEMIAAIDGDKIDEVAASYGISSHEFKRISGRILSKDSSFESLTEDGFEFASGTSSPESILSRNNDLAMNRLKLTNALDLLSTRDAYILRSRRLTEPIKGLKDLSEELGISMERVRQLENRAFKKICKTIST